MCIRQWMQWIDSHRKYFYYYIFINLNYIHRMYYLFLITGHPLAYEMAILEFTIEKSCIYRSIFHLEIKSNPKPKLYNHKNEEKREEKRD